MTRSTKKSFCGYS